MNRKHKQGIAMIELIFALVIIGIVLMSAPMLIFQASQSNNLAIQQEAISAISAHTNILMSKHWDEADANLSAGVAPILTTTLINSFLEINNTTYKRAGLYNESSRLTLYNSTTLPASSIGSEGDDRDDVDDYHDTDNNVSVYANQSTNSQKGDYVDVNLNIHTEVAYVNDVPTVFDTNSTVNEISQNTAVTDTSNIKFIQVVLTSNSGIKELDKNITLKAFSCNIGTVSINGKRYE